MRVSHILFIVQRGNPWQVGGRLHSGQDLHHQDQEWHQNTGISSPAAGGHRGWGQGQTRECWERAQWLQAHHTAGWSFMGYASICVKYDQCGVVGILKWNYTFSSSWFFFLHLMKPINCPFKLEFTIFTKLKKSYPLPFLWDQMIQQFMIIDVKNLPTCRLARIYFFNPINRLNDHY